MLQFSIKFEHFCNDSRNDVGYSKHLSDLRKHSAIDSFFHKAWIEYLDLFHVWLNALMQHLFERPSHPPPNSRYSLTAALPIFPGNGSKTEHDPAIALIAQHHSKNPGSPCSAVASIAQAGPYSGGNTSVRSLSYNSSFISLPELPTASVQAQTYSTPAT